MEAYFTRTILADELEGEATGYMIVEFEIELEWREDVGVVVNRFVAKDEETGEDISSAFTEEDVIEHYGEWCSDKADEIRNS